MRTQDSIINILVDALAPLHLEVVNESHMHNVPPDSETHFKVVCVSSAFEELRPVKRHQKIYALLEKPLQEGVHALSLHLYTQTEWQVSQQVPRSPQCLGGDDSASS